MMTVYGVRLYTAMKQEKEFFIKLCRMYTLTTTLIYLVPTVLGMGSCSLATRAVLHLNRLEMKQKRKWDRLSAGSEWLPSPGAPAWCQHLSTAGGRPHVSSFQGLNIFNRNSLRQVRVSGRKEWKVRGIYFSFYLIHGPVFGYNLYHFRSVLQTKIW